MFDLKEFLRKRVNERISEKMKAKHQHPEDYMKLRNEIEDRVIFETDFYSLSEQSDIENMCPIDEKTLMLVTIEALKQYADNEDTENPKCVYLHNLYLKLKESLSSQIPFEKEDRFLDYLNSKEERRALENVRFTGAFCPSCGSKRIISNGHSWKCKDCEHEFRKRKGFISERS